MPKREDNKCYVKLVCNKADHMRVLGFHALGPNAGEVTQVIRDSFFLVIDISSLYFFV